MKRNFFFSLILLLLSIGSIHAQDSKTNSNWFCSFTKLSTLQYGTLGEYVFDFDTSDRTYKKLSYLEWEMKPVENVGFQLSGGFKNLSISGYATEGMPFRTGFMYDSDWMGLDSVKTNYSISQNTLDYKYNLGAQIAFKIYFDKDFSIAPSIAFDYEYVSFTARNGYGWYGNIGNSSTGTNVSYDSPYAKEYSIGELCSISYIRNTYYTWVGFTSLLSISDKFTTGVSFFISPYIYVQSLDKHYNRLDKSTYKGFIDIMSGSCCYVKGNIYFQYVITKQYSLKCSIDGLTGMTPLGITYYYYGYSGSKNTASLLSSKSESDVNLLSTTIAFEIRFF